MNPPSLICAPMATLSHEAFRRAIEKFGGCDEYFTEMINASSLVKMGPFEKYYLLSGPVPEKIVWQLTGWDAKTMAQASLILAEQGGIGIDLNMGCSAPQIYKTGAGISWMLKPLEETQNLVKSVKQVLNTYESQTGKHLRLSVKCRLGGEDFSEEGFFSFTDMLVNNGVELITLHARTIKEKYRTLPKYEYVEKLSLRYKDRGIKVILNGDVKDFNSALFALEKAPHISGIMIARAAAVKPWIFSQIKRDFKRYNQESKCFDFEQKNTVDREQLCYDFIDDVVSFQPQEFHKTRIQRFFNYYCTQFSFGHYFQSKMLNYKGIEEAKEQVKDYFLKQPSDKIYTY